MSDIQNVNERRACLVLTLLQNRGCKFSESLSEGVRTFAPLDDSLEALEAFQSTYAALRELETEGDVEFAWQPHRSSDGGYYWVDSVSVIDRSNNMDEA